LSHGGFGANRAGGSGGVEEELTALT
jgi:hypothetical protein